MPRGRYGLAENFLGTWLNSRRPPKEAFTVGSKWGYTYVGSWQLDAPVHEVKDLSVTTLRRQIAESRSLLGDRLALYEIHSATLESRVLENVEVLRELSRLRSAGLVIGLTVTGPNQADTIRRALHVSIDGVNPFQVVQATWNLLERSAETALAEAKARGWGVIVKEALANGRLTGQASGEHLTALGKAAGGTRDDRRCGRSCRGAVPALGRCRALGCGDNRTARQQRQGGCTCPATDRLARHRRIASGLLGATQRSRLAVNHRAPRNQVDEPEVREMRESRRLVEKAGSRVVERAQNSAPDCQRLLDHWLKATVVRSCSPVPL